MLADDLYRVAHHDVTGRALQSEGIASLALAAALIVEALSARVVELTPNDLLVTGVANTTGLGREVAAEPTPQPLATWIRYLAVTATWRVTHRLVAAGELNRRRRWGRDVFVPADINSAALPIALLSTKLRRSIDLTFDEACLAGLIVASGLDRTAFDGAPENVRHALRWYAARLWPPAQRVVEELRISTGSAVLAGRG